ncbi:hypothetical protein PM082_012954 [Marasmius tenuissimus]|nr:hypothetical protein PM082_012954 [Marasmius tenuissimus]
MQYSIVALRYTVFGLLVAFNAVVASVAVWNLTFLDVLDKAGRGPARAVDCFLIFVGTSGLVVVFSILFIELARRNALTSRLWFEAGWSCLFFLMDLSGAIAFTVIVPKQTCNEARGDPSCRSTHVLMAFVWMTTVLLLLYCTILAAHTMMSSKGDCRVWTHSIHYLPPLPKSLSTATPVEMPRSWKPEAIAAPQPLRPTPTVMYSYRSGLSPDYRIEHFEPPPENLTSRLSSTIQPAAFHDPPPRNALYPQFLQPTLTADQPSSASPQNLPASSAPPQSAAVPTPSPLGDWPRADIMKRPSDRKPARNSRVPASKHRSEPNAASNPVSPPPPIRHSDSRPRPSGPRTSHRPLPPQPSGARRAADPP